MTKLTVGPWVPAQKRPSKNLIRELPSLGDVDQQQVISAARCNDLN